MVMAKSVSKIAILIGFILIVFSIFYIFLLGFDVYGFTLSLGILFTIVGIYDYHKEKK